MAGKYVTLDEALIEQAQQIAQIPSEQHEEFLSTAVKLLQGIELNDTIRGLSQSLGIKIDALLSLLHCAGAILWEFAKGSPSDSSIVAISLQQVGLPIELAEHFASCYNLNKRSLAALKGALEISHPRFRHLAWRVDIELARRNMSTMAEPKFQLRLDLQVPSQTETSLHLQCDYSNMKRMQKELQLAVEELAGTHCQRLTRYIT